MGLSPNTPSFATEKKYRERLAETDRVLALSLDEFAAEKLQKANDAKGYSARLAWKEKQRKEKL